MKFSNINLAILALSLGVSAAPQGNYGLVARDCDESASASASGLAGKVNAAAKTSSTSTKKSSASTTKKSSVATSSGKAKASTSSSSKKASTTSATTTSGSSSGSSGGSLPASSGTSVLSAAQTIAAGGSFDGGMVSFDRGVSCTGQEEGDDSDAVFNIEEGGSLSNVIIGANQIEGVHCQGACTLTNVWWAAVCEDAFTIKLQDADATTTINGGGAFGAEDKVIQHNGAGTVKILDFTVDTFGKLYRSCGNCKASNERHVIIDNITASNGDLLVGVNGNFGDTATITNSALTSVDEVCTNFKGVASGSEPTEVSSGADGSVCIFGSDVTSA